MGPSRRGPALFLAPACALFSLTENVAGAVELSRAAAAKVGQQIWQNECAGTVAGLTSWNTGENFASLGIGHFIWYPKGVRGPFEESFPDLARFIAERGVTLPRVVSANRESGCPWPTRAAFNAAGGCPEMRELRSFLARTVDLQTTFLIQRLQQALPKMLAEAPAAERAAVERQFERVASSARGCYALIDYVNFKGEGVLDSERYRGQGWGLLQVLQGMSETKPGSPSVTEFARSARAILTQRVKNSPAERNETRWLPGWLQRVSGYTHWNP